MVCYSFNSDSILGASNSTLGPCASSSYQTSTCCKVGDTCYQNGLCLSSTDKVNVPWYLGGCTSQSGGSTAACPGFCPNGYPAAVYDTYLDEWKCCPTYPSNTDSLTGCVLPKYIGTSGSSRYIYSSPNELQATAVVKGTSSYSALPYSTSTYRPYAYTYTYSTRSSSYYDGYYYGYRSTSTSAGYRPTNTGLGSDSASRRCELDDNCYYGGPSPLLLIVIIIPTIVGVALIGVLIWLMVRAHRKHQKKYPNPSMPLPVGEQVHQHVLAGYTPQQSKDMYDRKMNAMSWMAQQPPQPPQPGQQEAGEIAPPLPARNPPETPNGQSRGIGGAPAPLLPPIQEVSNIEPSDIVSDGPTQAEGAAAGSAPASTVVHSEQPAQPAASSAPADAAWPLTGGAPVATEQSREVSETPVSQPSDSSATGTQSAVAHSGDQPAAHSEGGDNAEQARSSAESRRHRDEFYR